MGSDDTDKQTSVPCVTSAAAQARAHNIFELNHRRAEAEFIYNVLGSATVKADPTEKVRQDAQYRLAYDNWRAADKAYNDALSGMSRIELAALATASIEAPTSDAHGTDDSGSRC